MTLPLYVGLVHSPVLNRERSVVTTAITNLDIHDIARVARTYGVQRYFVITPISAQRTLVERIVDHWCRGHGATRVPERGDALRLVETVPTIGTAIERTTALAGGRPLVVATCARPGRATLSFVDLRGRIGSGSPVLVLLGTGWGLADDVLADADGVLEAVAPPAGDYNHLSVRSAAAVILDRLVARRC